LPFKCNLQRYTGAAHTNGGEVSSAEEGSSDDSAYNKDANNRSSSIAIHEGDMKGQARRESSSRTRFTAKQQAAARLVRRFSGRSGQAGAGGGGGGGEEREGGGLGDSAPGGGAAGQWATQPFQRSQQRANVSAGRSGRVSSAAAAPLAVSNHMASSFSYQSSTAAAAAAADDHWRDMPPRMASPTMKSEPLTSKGSDAVVVGLYRLNPV
jgi:hypothetical protein